MPLKKAQGEATWVFGRELSKWRLKIKMEISTGESISKRGKGNKK